MAWKIFIGKALFLAVCFVPLLTIILGASARPISDDICLMADARDLNLIEHIALQSTGGDGRPQRPAISATLMAKLFAPFGQFAAEVQKQFLFIALAASASLLISKVLTLGGYMKGRNTLALGLGALLSASFAASAYNGDTIGNGYWMSIRYSLTLALLCLFVWLILETATGPQTKIRRRLGAFGAFILSFLMAGSESGAVWQLWVHSILVAVALLSWRFSGRGYVYLLVAGWLGCLFSGLAMLLLLTSSGGISMAMYFDSLDLKQVLASSWYKAIDARPRPGFGLMFCAGAFAGLLQRVRIDKSSLYRSSAAIIAFATITLIALVVVHFVIMGWSGRDVARGRYLTFYPYFLAWIGLACGWVCSSIITDDGRRIALIVFASVVVLYSLSMSSHTASQNTLGKEIAGAFDARHQQIELLRAQGKRDIQVARPDVDLGYWLRERLDLECFLDFYDIDSLSYR